MVAGEIGVGNVAGGQDGVLLRDGHPILPGQLGGLLLLNRPHRQGQGDGAQGGAAQHRRQQDGQQDVDPPQGDVTFDSFVHHVLPPMMGMAGRAFA